MVFDAFFPLNFVCGTLFERLAGDMKKEPVFSDAAPDQGGYSEVAVNAVDVLLGLRLKRRISMTVPPLALFLGSTRDHITTAFGCLFIISN